MANEVLSTVTSSDQEKFLAAKLIARAYIKMVAVSLCDRVQQPEGTGLTANFVRYQRMNVPLATLSEGIDPPNNAISVQAFSVTLDQWGDIVTLTDVAQLTTKHPLVQQATELLADNAQRVIDREVQLVWLAGTNVIFGDSSVTSRGSITSGMKISDTAIHRAVVTHVKNGTPPRGGPSGGYSVEDEDSDMINQGLSYAGVAGPQVIHDIMQTGTSLGSWAAVAMYANAKALYNAEVGMWLNVRWVESNFIPVFQTLGNAGTTITTGNAFGTDTPVVSDVSTGGSLNATATYAFVVTKKDQLRGFEEFISQVQSITTGGGGNTHSLTFNFSSLSSGFVWNLYFDNTQAGSGAAAALTKMQLVQANIALGTTVTVTAVTTSGANPPAAPAVGVNVYPVYVIGEEASKWVGLQNLQVFLTRDEATTDNPLKLRRKIAYKFLGKTIVPDSLRILRLEFASTYI